MFRKFVHFVLLVAVLAGLFTFAPATPTYAAEPKEATTMDESMLNVDGTLNMSNLPTGPMDLSGWDVSLDPTRGPVFSPIASEDNWAEVDTAGPINDDISVIFLDGSDVYIGGRFTNAGGVDEADYIARWDGASWHSLSSNGAGNGAVGGQVIDIIKIGSVLYVAGGFSYILNTSNVIIQGSNALAKWDGNVWSSADGDTVSAMNNSVYSLAYQAGSPGYLYAAGQFTDVDGIAAADRIVRLNLDTNTWEALGADSGGDGAIDAWTLSVVVDSTGAVYIGGFFTNADEIAEADYIAKWDTINDWQSLGSTPLNGIVGDVVVDASNNVYAGGNFVDAGGNVEADYIAKWNGSAWSALGNNGAGNGAVKYVNGGGGGTTVQDLYIVGNELYAVGLVGLANNATADYVIKYDLNSGDWNGFGSNGSGNGSISNAGFPYAVAAAGSTLYIGGNFPDVNDSGTSIKNSSNFAAYATSAGWQGFDGETALFKNATINALVSTGSDVYIGGSFSNLKGNPNMDYIIRWDGTNWHSLGNEGTYYAPLTGGSVQDIEVVGNFVYVVGTFTSAVNSTGNLISGTARIAKWDGASWSAVGGGISNGSVNEIEVDGDGNVYIGGSFTNAGGNSAADQVAMWDGINWNSLSSNGAGEGPIPSGNVYALTFHEGNLYVGGDFLNVVNTSNAAISNTTSLAVWNGSIWSAALNLTSPLSSTVFAITSSGSDLYIGGSFNNLNSMPAADHIAKWNGSAWSALGSGFGGEGSLNQLVRTIVVRGTHVYAGGNFNSVYNGGTAVGNAKYIAEFDGANWSGLGSDGTSGGSLSSIVYDMVFHENDLWVGGNFQNVNNNGTVLNHADYLAVFGLPTPTPLPASWVGSTSVTSDKELVTVGRPHIGPEVASYNGFTSGSLSSFVPMLFKDAFGGSYDAALYVQNVSTSSANITLQFYDSFGVLNCTKVDSIVPLASKGYWLPSVSCDSGPLPTGWVGGVKVSSDQPIVAVGRPHIGSEVMTYNGFSAGSTAAFVPMLFKGAFGGSYNAAFYIQNVDTTNTANVTIEYFDSSGTLNCTKTDTLAPLASKGYWVPTVTCDSGSLPTGWVGGVKVTSDQPIVTVGRPHIDTQITTYNGFASGSPSSYVPMLFKDAFGGSYDAAFYLQNTHPSNTASITIKYYDNTGTLNCTKSDTLAPLASKGYWAPAATCDTGSLPSGWVGGVEVTSDQSIVSIGRPHIGAQVTTYNGFLSGDTSNFLPMLFKNAFGGSYNAAFYLQNTEDATANVTIQFFDSAGTLTCSRTDTIPPRATLGLWVPSATCYP